MAKEIERKFLVAGGQWRDGVERATMYRQGYLVADPPVTVRVRIDAGGARLNIKIGGTTISRDEYEYPIPTAEAREILDRHCCGSVIRKTRHYVPYAGLTWEVDVFEGDNAGLVVAEVELDSEDQKLQVPDWVGKEVSADPRYYNVSLAKRPYKAWD